MGVTSRFGMANRMVMLVLLLCLCSATRSMGADLEVLNLEQLINLAVEHSPEIKESQQDVVAAEGDLMQAKGGMLPQVELTGTAGPVEDAELPTVVVDQEVSPGVFQGYIKGNDGGSVTVFGRLDLAIVQPLYTFGKISNRKDAAALGVEAEKHGKDVRTSDVILNTKELYYSMIVAGQGEGAARQAGDFIRDARRRIERMIAAGSTNTDESDLYRLEAFEAQIERFKAQAESGRRLAYLALKKAIGYPEEKDFKLDVKELPTQVQSLRGLDEYTRMALDNRPEIKQLEKGIAAKESLVRAGEADLYPSFFLAGIGSVAGAPERDRMPISYFPDDYNHSYMGVIIGSEWKFDLGIHQGKLKKARAEHQKLLHTRELAQDKIPLQVSKYYEDALEAEKSLNAYRKGSVAARKWIVASFSNFDFGVGTAKDMFDAIDRYGKNEGEYLLALLNYNLSLARLEHSVGLYMKE